MFDAGVVTADLASARGARPAMATRPINLARKLFRVGSWLTSSVVKIAAKEGSAVSIVNQNFQTNIFLRPNMTAADGPMRAG